jgi:hypothetical protein
MAPTEVGYLSLDQMGRSDSGDDAGTAVGYGRKFVAGSESSLRAVRWDAGGTAVTELGHLGTTSAGYTHTEAVGVDAAGNAFGGAQKYDGIVYLGSRAVRWPARTTTPTELGNLGTRASGYTQSHVTAVNRAGTAVGEAQKYIDNVYFGERPVRWDAGGTTATELGVFGTVSGMTAAWALAINASSTAVGSVADYEGGTFVGYRATLWGTDAVPIDLNTLIDPASGWTLTEADSISDTHFVAGVGLFDPDGPGPAQPYTRAFLMNVSSVVPEPGALTMFIALPLLSRRARR